MIVQQEGGGVVLPDALVRRRQTLDNAFIVLFFTSLGGMSAALWAKGDVAVLYSLPTVLVLLTQAAAAFGRRLRVQVRASMFTLASAMGVALALPELGSGLPVVLVSAATTMGFVVLLARQLEQTIEHNAELFAVRPVVEQRSEKAELVASPDSEQPASVTSQRANDLQTLGLLAATLVHDFKNLLSVMLANTSALKAQLPSDVEELDEIEQAAHEATDLCKRVLSVSRESTHGMENSNLNRMVQTELPLIRRLASARVQVIWEPGPELWFLASRTEFRQLLLNLCANARDAMPKGGELRLRTVISQRPARRVPGSNHSADSSYPAQSYPAQSYPAQSYPPAPGPAVVSNDVIAGVNETESCACLIISDNGVGMDEATQAHIFEPFFTTKTPTTGTGLGMAVVAAAVERHNAQIEVRSEPNVGTTISIFFPEVVAVQAPEGIPSQSMTRELAGGRETILVVEDDARVLRAISRTLRRHGYRVLGATDGREGMAALALKSVDLVICDLIMPVMDGTTLFAEVMKTHPKLPFLFCSGSVENILPQRGASNDTVARLSKPFTEESLLLNVKDLLALSDVSSLDEPMKKQMVG